MHRKIKFLHSRGTLYLILVIFLIWNCKHIEWVKRRVYKIILVEDNTDLVCLQYENMFDRIYVMQTYYVGWYVPSNSSSYYVICMYNILLCIMLTGTVWCFPGWQPENMLVTITGDWHDGARWPDLLNLFYNSNRKYFGFFFIGINDDFK